MILTLLLSTTKLTPDKVLQAMETIHIHDIYDWSKEVFGQSMLSNGTLTKNEGKKGGKPYISIFLGQKYLIPEYN